MQHQPLVSVLMTSYNREIYIVEAIESVLASTYQNFELIIVDDRSKDKTLEIAGKYAEKDGRIKVYQNEKNLGDYGNRNKAAAYATGYYIMHLDSDDTIFKEGIEMCVACMEQFAEAHFGMINYYIKEPQVFESTKAIREHLFGIPYLGIGPGGTIIKRSYFEQLNGFPEKYGPANDMYFNLKACSSSNIVMLPFEFHYYRRHEGQEINNYYSYLYNNYLYTKDALLELNLYLTEQERKWLNNKNNRRFLKNIVKYFLRSYNFLKVKEAFKRTGFSINDAMSGIFHLS